MVFRLISILLFHLYKQTIQLLHLLNPLLVFIPVFLSHFLRRDILRWLFDERSRVFPGLIDSVDCSWVHVVGEWRGVEFPESVLELLPLCKLEEVLEP